METLAYREMADHEQDHWWFAGRRAIIESLIERSALAPAATILEAGCGTGGNLYMLAGHGDVTAFEPWAEARSIARDRYPAHLIEDGTLPHGVPFPKASFDLVAVLDVLEHVEDDVASLRALVGMVKPGGSVIVTVPGHQALWSAHDRRLHHKRRYGRADFAALCAQSGAEVVYISPFNLLLALPAVILRIAERAGFGPFDQERVPPARINRLFTRIFMSEAAVLRRGRLPIGLSWAAILRRPAA